jgi:hypothetical protein
MFDEHAPKQAQPALQKIASRLDAGPVRSVLEQKVARTMRIRADSFRNGT